MNPERLERKHTAGSMFHYVTYCLFVCFLNEGVLSLNPN